MADFADFDEGWNLDDWITTYPHAHRDPASVCAVTGEPGAEERGLVVCPMTDDERREFGDRIERVAARHRAMTPADVERFLDELDAAERSDTRGA